MLKWWRFSCRFCNSPIGWLTITESLIVLLAIWVHSTCNLPLTYTWSRTLDLFAQAVTDRFFLTFAFLALAFAEQRAVSRSEPAGLIHVMLSVVLSAVLIGGLLGTSTAYSPFDLVFALPVTVLFFRALHRGDERDLLIGTIASLAVLIVVSYAFTIIKSQLFVISVPHDSWIISAETLLFGRPLFQIIAEWSSQYPALVGFCDWVYFLFFHHIALTGLFLFSLGDRIKQRSYVLSLATCYLFGGLSYYLFPTLGPVFFSPTAFSHLRIDTEYSFFIQDLLRRSTEGARLGTLETVETYAFIAGMPSLHMAHETIMLFFSRSSRLMFLFSAMFWLSSFLAVLVLGWHYLFDVIGGICLACAVLLIVRWVSQPGTQQYGSGS